jgi:hypothetical protein
MSLCPIFESASGTHQKDDNDWYPIIDELAQKIFAAQCCCSAMQKKPRRSDKTNPSSNDRIEKATEKSNASERPISMYQSSQLDQRSFDIHSSKTVQTNGKKKTETSNLKGMPGRCTSLRAVITAENALVGSGSYPA